MSTCATCFFYRAVKSIAFGKCTSNLAGNLPGAKVHFLRDNCDKYKEQYASRIEDLPPISQQKPVYIYKPKSINNFLNK